MKVDRPRKFFKDAVGTIRFSGQKVCRVCQCTYHPHAKAYEGSTACGVRCSGLMKRGRHLKRDVTYTGLHKRVQSLHGKAAQWPCSARCGESALHWACVGDYRDEWDYIPLCVKCHSALDGEQSGKFIEFLSQGGRL